MYLKKIAIIVIIALFLSTLSAQGGLSSAKNTREDMMREIHQQLAVDLFNQSWDVLLKPDRNRADEDLLLNMAHASLYHWRQIGEPINILRGEWMIAHVYTLLKHKESALYHAENVLRLMEEIKPMDWDLAYCYEAMARVKALWGDKDGFDQYYALALEAGKAIAGEGDRNQFMADLSDEYWFGMK